MKKEKNLQSLSKIMDNIKALRAIKNYSQQYIADKLGCDYSTYGKIESGKTTLTVNRLFLLADIFEVDVKQLLFGNEHSEPSIGSIGTATNSSPKIIIEIPLSGNESTLYQFKDIIAKLLPKN
jgi:transcriptional regulator with XRE-family HTH domain